VKIVIKKIIAGAFTLLVSALLINACKDNSTVQPVQDKTDYFPNRDGTTYTYSVEKTDSAGTQATGTRTTEYSGAEVKDNTTYQVQIDSLNTSGTGEISLTYFRKTDDGVFYYIDTSGFASYFPDSLRNYISIDTEMRELFFPLTAGSTWPVFKLILFNIAIINFSAAYDGMESITLHLASGDVSIDAVRVKYTLLLNIPDPNDPFNTISSSYTASAWFADEIGAIKWQGNSAILNAFAGGNIDLTDTTSVITQSLVSYNVK
jgi:hypothetical protein